MPGLWGHSLLYSIIKLTLAVYFARLLNFSELLFLLCNMRIIMSSWLLWGVRWGTIMDNCESTLLEIGCHTDEWVCCPLCLGKNACSLGGLPGPWSLQFCQVTSPAYFHVWFPLRSWVFPLLQAGSPWCPTSSMPSPGEYHQFCSPAFGVLALKLTS